MDQLDRHRSKWLENKPLAHSRCSKTPSTRPNTAGNRQAQTAAPATGEKGESHENSVLNPLHGVQFAIHAKGNQERVLRTPARTKLADTEQPRLRLAFRGTL